MSKDPRKRRKYRSELLANISTSHPRTRPEDPSKAAIGDGSDTTMTTPHPRTCPEDPPKDATGDGPEIVFLMAGKYMAE